MYTSRRFFLHKGALAVAGTAAIPSFLVRSVLAQTAAAPNRRLVVIFQRGAADGLNIVVPYREKNYYAMRPSIAIPQNQVLDLDGFFGLHPSLAPFKPLYDQGHLAIVHAAGSPDMSRSHFDAQDYMESGTPGVKSTQDGWLNRALQAEDLRRREQHTAFRALALGAEVPRTLAGKIPAIALNNVNSFAVGGTRIPRPRPPPAPSKPCMETAATTSSTPPATRPSKPSRCCAPPTPRSTRPAPASSIPTPNSATTCARSPSFSRPTSASKPRSPTSAVGTRITIRAASNGQLSNRLRDFSAAIAAFWRDLGDSAENVTLVTMSEFGRTARENGTGGTDHGHANAMFVLGGNVKGGKVYGRWPGLDNDQLNEGRDLALTTDYRQVLGEVVNKTLGANNYGLGLPRRPSRPQQLPPPRVAGRGNSSNPRLAKVLYQGMSSAVPQVTDNNGGLQSPCAFVLKIPGDPCFGTCDINPSSKHIAPAPPLTPRMRLDQLIEIIRLPILAHQVRILLPSVIVDIECPNVIVHHHHQ